MIVQTNTPLWTGTWIAQGFPIQGEDAPVGQTATGADGAPANGAPPPAQGPFGGFFIPLLVLLVAMIVFSIFGQRRDRKKREAMLSQIKKHDKVQTIGGVIGSIVEVKSDLVVLKVDESSNTRLTVARSAVQQVLSGSNVSAETTTKT